MADREGRLLFVDDLGKKKLNGMIQHILLTFEQVEMFAEMQQACRDDLSTNPLRRKITYGLFVSQCVCLRSLSDFFKHGKIGDKKRHDGDVYAYEFDFESNGSFLTDYCHDNVDAQPFSKPLIDKGIAHLSTHRLHIRTIVGHSETKSAADRIFHFFNHLVDNEILERDNPYYDEVIEWIDRLSKKYGFKHHSNKTVSPNI